MNSDFWDDAEKHWPAMARRDRTRVIVVRKDTRSESVIREEKQAIEALLPGTFSATQYDLEPVGEVFMMAYDPIRDLLIVKDVRETG